MPRYNPYGNRLQQPEQYDTGEVPYISYQSENTNPMLMQGMQQMQQRYDLAQTAIGKYLEENAAGKFRDADYENVVNSLNKKLEDIKTNVKDKYQGDYGAAANDVIQQLGKARSTFHQAEQAYAEEQKYLPIYQKLKSEGKLVTPKGYDPFSQKSIDEKGNFVGSPDYSQMYERNDYNKWIEENISNRLNQNITDNLTGSIKNAANGNDAFFIMQKVKGMAQNQIANQVSDEDVKMFVSQNPTYKVEFSDNKGNVDIDAARKFIVETAKNQVSQQVDRQLINNPYWKEKTSGDKLTNEPSNLFQTVDDLSKKEREIKKTTNYDFDSKGSLVIPAEARPSTSSQSQYGTLPITEYLTDDYTPDEKTKSAVVSDYSKSLEKFRKEFNIPTIVTDKKVHDMYQNLQNYSRETIGTLVTLPETLDYSKKNVVGMFVNENGFIAPNQDIYLNSKRIDSEDKVKYLRKKLGFSKDSDVATQMKKLHENAYIDFSGDSGPTALVGFVNNSKGETIRIELPTSREMQQVGKDIYTITNKIKSGDNNKITLANSVVLPSGQKVSKVKVNYNFDENDQPHPTLLYFDNNDNLVFQETSVDVFTSFLMDQAKSVLANFMAKK